MTIYKPHAIIIAYSATLYFILFIEGGTSYEENTNPSRHLLHLVMSALAKHLAYQLPIDKSYSVGYDMHTTRLELIRGFIESPRFHKRWFAYGLSEEHLLDLQLLLLDNPKAGVVIKGTGGLRKLRYAFPQRGKSGSLRVLYVDFETHERIYLVNVFAKNEMENITAEQRNNIRNALRDLECLLFKGGCQ